MFASPAAPAVKRSLARGSATAQNARTNISVMRTSYVSTECFCACPLDSELTMSPQAPSSCSVSMSRSASRASHQAPTSCSVSMSRSASRTGGSHQYYDPSTTAGTGSHTMQRATSSTLAEIGSSLHPSPSLSSYGIYASPSKGYPFPVMTPSPNICSLPMSRGGSGSTSQTSQYGPMVEAFENLNIAHGTTHYATSLSPFNAPISRGRYARAPTPFAPPLLLSVPRHFPVLSETPSLPPPSLETTSAQPTSVPPQRLRSILKKPTRSASIGLESTPVLSAPSIQKRTTFSNDTTEIGLASSAMESGLLYRSCRGRPPTPLPDMVESEGEASD